MKHTRKHNAGFTLIELVVAMAIAVVVTAAATSVLLMGLRINRQTGDTASQQITVRTLLTTVENIITEGNISRVEMNTESWKIVDTAGKVLLSYYYDADEYKDTVNGTIYVGDYENFIPVDPVNDVDDADDASEPAVPILTGLLSSYVELYDGVFTISVETEDGMYSSSVYCRAVAPESNNDVNNGDNYIGEGEGDDTKTKFLNALKLQYHSRGTIWKKEEGKEKYDTGEYYSEWYIDKDYDDNEYDNGWNEKTPWCACYISWALIEAGITPPQDHERWFANVDRFMAYFTSEPSDKTATWLPGGSTPTAGDLIFFDWNKGTNPQHVGVVLKVDEHMVYTIEGNSSGRVAVRSYSLGDKRILGYGVLPWKQSGTDTETETGSKTE